MKLIIGALLYICFSFGFFVELGFDMIDEAFGAVDIFFGVVFGVAFDRAFGVNFGMAFDGALDDDFEEALDT